MIAAVVFIGWVFSVCLHEFGHALVAYWGGDTSVKDKGYLTFNILKYTDPQVTFVFPIVILMMGGVALPGAAVYIDRGRLRSKLWQSAVSAAGPYASAIAGVLFALPFLLDLSFPNAAWLMQGLAFLVVLQAISIMFNLLPIPGFDGFGIIEPWLPPAVQRKAYQFGTLGMWLAFIVLWNVRELNMALWDSAFYIGHLFGISYDAMRAGNEAFFANRWWLALGLVAAVLLSRRHQEPTAEQYYATARQEFTKNKIEEALASVTNSLRLQPGSAEAWHLRALCLGILGRNQEALPCFDSALELRPDYADGWYNKACCLALQGQNDAALNSLQQAVTLGPHEQLKEHARKEVAFKNLQTEPRFQQLTEP